jgi:hypothetical protein
LCANCILGALTFSITPRSVIVFADCAAMVQSEMPHGQPATVFMSIDLFIFLPSGPALTGHSAWLRRELGMCQFWWSRLSC